MGYQEDTPASVIFYATNLLQKACDLAKSSEIESVHLHWKNIIMQSGLDINYIDVHQICEGTTMWMEAVCYTITKST